MNYSKQATAQWVSNDYDASSQMNNDAFMTHLLFTELCKQTENEDILSLFWANLAVVPRKIGLQAMWSEHGVYCYPQHEDEIVLSTPMLEVRIDEYFNVNIDYKSVSPELVTDGLLPILKTILDKDIITTAKCSDDSTRNYLSIGQSNISLKEAFNSAAHVIKVAVPRATVASPVKKQHVVKDPSTLELRPTYGWKKSYKELRDILDDYILDASDIAVLPVVNADLLDYLKLEGGVYIDGLTEVQVTYEDRDITVCADQWKIILSAKHRNGRYTIYSTVSSTDASHPEDVRELAKVLHALNNLYKKYKKNS